MSLSINCPKCGRPKLQANVPPAVSKLSADALYLFHRKKELTVNTVIDEALSEYFAPPAPSWFFAGQPNRPEADPQQNPRHYLNTNAVNAEDENTVPEPPSWFFK